MTRAVYVAGCLERATEAHRLALALVSRGVGVTSRWHETGETRDDKLVMLAPRLDAIAADNLADLGRADTVVWLLDPRSRGALVEVGWAAGRGAVVVAIGTLAGITPMARGCIARLVPDAAAFLALLDGAP